MRLLPGAESHRLRREPASGHDPSEHLTIEQVFDTGGFAHLDVRSAFSLKEGAFVPEHLAALAGAMRMPAVALTDRDGLYGAARFVSACQAEGVRPILGASLTIRERGADAPVVLLAQDDRGYANLCRLITDAHMLGERGDPST